MNMLTTPIKRFFIVGGFLLLNISSFCAEGQSLFRSALQHKIDKTLNDFKDPAIIGIRIQSLSSQKILYEKYTDKVFTPASTLKIITAYAALKYLGLNYQYDTLLLQDANKDIIIQFSGDPDFKIQDLDALLNKLSKQGVKKISGNLYVDESRFAHQYDLQKYASGWMAQDLNFGFAAPIDALMINKNLIDYNLTVNGLEIEKPNANQKINQLIAIKNQITHIPANSSSEALEKCTVQLEVNDKNNSILLSGCLPQNFETKPIPVAIKNPENYIQQLLPLLLQKNHMVLSGHIEFKSAPKNSVVIASHVSQPLVFLIHEMLKNSDNIIAECLFKTLGALYFKEPGDWNNGFKAIQAILLQNTKINWDHLSMDDGDGQSRYNLVTPYQLSALLFEIYHDASIESALISALPIMGVDGTLKKRLVGVPIVVKAKTGTMTGVSSLAGYVQTKNGDINSVVIILNNHAGNNKTATNLEDSICKIVAGIE